MISFLLLSCFNHVWLCTPLDCSPPGSSVHGILQARILEQVATPSSRGSSQPRDGTHVSWVSCIAGGFVTTVPPGKSVLLWLYPYFSGLKIFFLSLGFPWFLREIVSWHEWSVFTGSTICLVIYNLYFILFHCMRWDFLVLFYPRGTRTDKKVQWFAYSVWPELEPGGWTQVPHCNSILETHSGFFMN